MIFLFFVYDAQWICDGLCERLFIFLFFSHFLTPYKLTLVPGFDFSNNINSDTGVGVDSAEKS